MAITLSLLRVATSNVVTRRSLTCSVVCHAVDSKPTTKENKDVLAFGCIHDKKPVKVLLEDGKLYSWCTCGTSKKQPFCDNSHRKLHEADADPTKLQFRSYKFQVDKKKEYFLCMCKQTLNRPFCDGTHKKKEIQDAVLPIA